MTHADTAVSDCIARLEALREHAPLVHCLTNEVVTGFTANVLLSLGASPAMVDTPGEAGAFAGIADGVLLNLGTIAPLKAEGMLEAADAASAAGIPWVLDPVAIGVLPIRTALAATLRARRPGVIRGNPSEILALAGAGVGGRGTDSIATPDDAADAARALARECAGIVAVSGPVDLITDGERVVRISSGHPLLTRITGGGCALGAVIAAFVGRAPAEERLDAVVAAATVYTVAAEMAAEIAPRPGSFLPAFVDALDAVGAEELRARTVIA